MEKLYINDTMLFKHKLPQDLHTAFQIIKLHNNIIHQISSTQE